MVEAPTPLLSRTNCGIKVTTIIPGCGCCQLILKQLWIGLGSCALLLDSLETAIIAWKVARHRMRNKASPKIDSGQPFAGVSTTAAWCWGLCEVANEILPGKKFVV